MCDCAEEQERRRRAELERERAGSNADSEFGDGGPDGGGSVALRVFFGGSAFLVGVLGLLHRYLDIFGPLLEKYGLRPKKCGPPDGKKHLDPNDPDPERCDGLRLDPCKRKWPIKDKN